MKKLITIILALIMALFTAQTGLANTKMLDYLDEWLEGHQHDIERETYHQYKRYIDGRIREFFTPLDLTVKDLSGDEINEFYTYLRNAGLKGSTGQRYHRQYLQPPRYRHESGHRRRDE